MRINKNNNTNFKGLPSLANPLYAFHNANATIPTLIIESGVTLGRSFEANKRGGKIEATERFVEQGISALVWIYGVQTLKKMGDFIGKNVFKIENLNFDVGSDALRNPIKNNMLSKKAVGFKAANILTSTAIATAFIGFVLPKINHFITNKTLKKNSPKKEQEKSENVKILTLKEFQENTKNKKDNNLSFTSLIDKGIKLSHTLENNSSARLLITDTGVVGGRFKNGRNKYEKIEGLFRDISSIYFYLFSTKHFVKLFNFLSGNKDINPEIAKATADMLQNIVKDKNIAPDELSKLLAQNIKKEDLEKLDILFKENKTISVKDFVDNFGLKEKAQKMSELQPFFENNPILSKLEAKDVLSNSITSEPEFLKNVFNGATKGASDDKLKYVSQKHLENLRKQIDEFIEQTIQKAKNKGKSIDTSFIQKCAKENITKNFVHYSLATGISIFALGILIPKVQYLITKKLTKENEFPGVKEYK